MPCSRQEKQERWERLAREYVEATVAALEKAKALAAEPLVEDTEDADDSEGVGDINDG